MCRELFCSVFSGAILALGMGLFVTQGQASLAGYWKFDESSGTTAPDSAGGDNDGNLSGDVQWQPEASRSRGALLYSSEDNTARVEIPTTGMSASEGTMMVWGNLAEPFPTNRNNSSYLFGHTTQPSYANRLQLYIEGELKVSGTFFTILLRNQLAFLRIFYDSLPSKNIQNPCSEMFVISGFMRNSYVSTTKARSDTKFL